MYARTQPEPFTWPFFTSFLLLVFGGMLLWVHFSAVLPTVEAGRNVPLRILVPLHVWAFANLLTATMTLALGGVSMFCPGVAKITTQTPISWIQYRVIVTLVLVSDIFLLASALCLSVELAGWALFMTVVQFALVMANFHFVYKLYFQKL